MTKEKEEHYVITIMMYGYYDFYPFHILGSIFVILFWVIVLVALLRFVLGGRGYGHWRGRHDANHPMEILKERYAKGEITKEQFTEMKKDIE